MIEITTIYFVWLLRIFQPYLILSIEILLSTKPLLNLPIVNRCTPFGVIILFFKFILISKFLVGNKMEFRNWSIVINYAERRTPIDNGQI